MTNITKKQQEWLTANNMTLPIKCKMCDNHVKWNAQKGIFRIYCSNDCKHSDIVVLQEKRKGTCVKRYGYENPQQSQKVRNKTKATNIERYGCEYGLQSEEIKEKKKATCLVKYGVENPFGSDCVQEKIKVSMLERHGVEHPAQSEEMYNKMKTTMIERHGVEYAQQSEEIRNKSRATNLERLGVEHPSQSEEVKAKIKATNIERFGGHHTQSHMSNSLRLLHSRGWLEGQYITQKKTLTQIGKELGVGDTTIGRYAKTHDIEIRPNEIGSSYPEREWIEGIMESEGIFIQYSGNGQQYKIPGTRWRADGYCAETNTIYEFHGSVWHGNPRLYEPDEHPHSNIPKTADELYQKTKEREQIIVNLGYHLVVMWDDGFTYTIKGDLT